MQITTKQHFHPALKAGLKVEIVEQKGYMATVKLIDSRIKSLFTGPLLYLKGVEIGPEAGPAIKLESIGGMYRATVYYKNRAPIVCTMKNKVLAEKFLNASAEEQRPSGNLAKAVRRYVWRKAMKGRNVTRNEE